MVHSNEVSFGSSEIYEFDVGSIGQLKDWSMLFNCLLWNFYIDVSIDEISPGWGNGSVLGYSYGAPLKDKSMTI